MDARTLSEVMGNVPGVDYAALLPGYENAAIAANINTADRAAMWAAQLGHESVGLKYMEEIADGSAYNGRADLGNVYPGDGPRFKGRGPIQLTGRANYRAFTRWANANGHSDIDFEANPHRVAEPHWGFLAATYFWLTARSDHASGGRSALNRYSDERNVLNASRVINGWFDVPNGMADRSRRYDKALAMGARLLPGEPRPVQEKILDYSRDQIAQDTFYNCGPASVQTVVKAATGTFLTESELGAQLGTHTGGTDWIGQFPTVLNRHVPGADYKHVEMPNDPPTDAQKDRLWADITNSINAGFGVVANIVAPVNNYPRAVYPSTIHPAYAGGMVYHYIALMGWRDDGQRKVWVADSGFTPYGYWISFDQLATLIPPKGYAYASVPAPAASTATTSPEPTFMEALMSQTVPSFVNPNKEFPANISLGLIDRQGWEDGVLSRALFYALGLDPHKVLTAAVEADNAGGDVDAAIRSALGIKEEQ